MKLPASIAPTRLTEGNSADAVNKGRGAGFMMADLIGMEFAVRKGGREESPSPSKAFIPLLLRLVRRSLPLVLAKSLPRQIVHRAHSDNTRRKERQSQRRSD